VVEIDPVDVAHEPVAQPRLGGYRCDDVLDESNRPVKAQLDCADLLALPSEPDRTPARGPQVAGPVRLSEGLMKPRRPPCSQIVTGVVRGTPDRLPRTVRRMSGPIGTPSASSGFATALKYGAHLGNFERRTGAVCGSAIS
jgi:hypothetical protein